jgi:hypothetical protein
MAASPWFERWNKKKIEFVVGKEQKAEEGRRRRQRNVSLESIK